MPVIGRVLQRLDSFLWVIPGFAGLPKDEGIYFYSPSIDLAETRWWLILYPNGTKSFPHRIVLGLSRCDVGPAKTFHCTVGVSRADGEEEPVGNQTVRLGGRYLNHVLYPFYRRAEVCKEGEFLSSDDTLTLTLCLREGEAESQGGTFISQGTQTEDLNYTCRRQNDTNDESSASEAKGVTKLRSDYKKLLESGAESDFLVVVSGREFRVHKGILRVRSAVFDAMFDHESKEKENGKVVIDDLHPDAFRDFLEYMYTGRLEAYSEEAAFRLYTTADRYDVQELKSEVVEYMQHTLSVETFCDVMLFLLKHHESELMDYAIDFFKANLYDIFVTEKWQVFLKENTTAANELLIKSHAPAENR